MTRTKFPASSYTHLDTLALVTSLGGLASIMMALVISLDCSQPLCFSTHAKEKASRACEKVWGCDLRQPFLKNCRKGEKAEIKRLCACFFAICLRNFGKTSHISTENVFVEPRSEGVTLSVTQLCCAECLFFNMFWNFASKSPLLRQKQACISLLQSVEACHPLLTKQWKESHALPSLLFVLTWCFWVAKQKNNNNHNHSQIFGRCVEFIDISD